MKKFLTLVVCLLCAFAFVKEPYADQLVSVEANSEETEKKVNVYIFTKEQCPYCEKAKTFLNELLDDENYNYMFQIREYRVWGASWEVNEKNMAIMNSVGKYFDVEVTGAPYIVIGTEFNENGFSEAIGESIKKAIEKAYNDDEYTDLVNAIVNNNGKLPKEFQDDNTVATIIGISIIVPVVGGLSALIIFSRKGN